MISGSSDPVHGSQRPYGDHRPMTGMSYAAQNLGELSVLRGPKAGV